MRYSTFTRHVQALKPQSLSAGAEAFTSGIDCLGYRWAEVVLLTGTATGSIAAANIQESSDDGSVDAYADVTSADFTAITSANDDAAYVIRLDLTKRERYIRVGYDVDTNAVLAAVHVVLMDPVNAPATASATIVATV